MNDYPIVYGYCEAGCKRRVVPYEQMLDNYAIIADVTMNSDGTFNPEQGKTYKISNSNDTASWGFSILISPIMINTLTGLEQTPITWHLTLPAYDKYDNYITFRWLELQLEIEVTATKEYNIKLVCEINGERQTLTYSKVVSLINYDLTTLRTKVTVTNATEIRVFNEEAFKNTKF